MNDTATQSDLLRRLVLADPCAYAAYVAVAAAWEQASGCDCGDVTLCPNAARCFESTPYPFPPDAAKGNECRSSSVG